MKSRFKLPLAIALALGSVPALALQLGEIRVKSALDEPLVAEIPIQLDNLAEAKDLRVGLASPEDFAKAGLSRTGLEHLRFSVVSDSTGHKLLLVTSELPVSDPYLDFLIELDSGKGKQLREYTVLLDPVITAPPPEEVAVHGAPPAAQAAPLPPPVAAPTPAPPSRPAATAPASPPAPQPAPAAPPRATPAPVVVPNEYTVQSGDTLYHIASEMRPDQQVSVDQMMLALQSTNPSAFYRDNINNLKSGAILRIPTRDAIASTSAAQAHAQVRRQYEDWRGAAARKATTVAAAPAAQGASTRSSASEGDKLALVPPSQGGGSATTRAGEKGGTGTAEVAGLKQQIAASKETLASLKQENSELQSRVKDLEDISGKNQKLLAMKDAQIAELEAKLAQMQRGGPAAAAGSGSASASGAAMASAPANPASAAAPAASAGVTSTASSATPAAAGTAAPAAVMPQAAPVSRTASSAKPAVAPRKTAPAQPADVPWYQRPLTWVIGGVVIVLLILVGLFRRKPRPLPEPLDEPNGESLADHFGESPLDAEGESEEPVDEPMEDAPVAVPSEDVFDTEPEIEPAPPEQETTQPTGADYDFASKEPPSEEPVEPDMPGGPLAVTGPDDITRKHDAAPAEDGVAPEPVPERAAPVSADDDEIREPEPVTPEFSDDPVDTKLDLARAYLDMGDPAGARAMLEEVLNEGSQAQKDEAKRLLESVA